MQSVQAPDIFGVLAGPAERRIKPQIGPINGFCFRGAILLE